MSLWDWLFRRPERMMEDLDQEIHDHIERETQDNIERGMAPEEARHAALRKFGNVTQIKEEMWEVWSLTWLEQLWQDIRFGLRMLAKSPGFTVLVTGLLALGIGATTVMFSLFDAVFLRPLPVRNPSELVRMVQHTPPFKTTSIFTYSYFKALRDHSTTLEAAFGEAGYFRSFAMSDPEPAEDISVFGVTPEFFTVLGGQALYGRVLLPDDASENTGLPPAVLSYGFWQRRFQGDPGIVNKGTLLVNGHRFVIVGIMPRDFNGITVDTAPDIRVPLRAYLALVNVNPDRLWMELAGRLKPGIKRSQAEAECRTLWRSTEEARLRDVFKETPQAISTQLAEGMSLEDIAKGVSLLRDRFGDVLKLVMGSIALLLLIVCTNVAGVLLERAAARQQEIAVRLAVGASRFRIIRQVLKENMLLAVLGTAGGLAIAVAGIPLALRALPPIRAYPSPSIVPLGVHLAINWRIFLFLMVVSLVTVVLFSLSPAVAVARSNLEALLRGSRSSARVRGRRALIALQIALCTFLLVAASLLVRTFERLQSVNPGFDRDHIATFTIDLSTHKGQRTGFLTALTERVSEMPGVASVGLSSMGVMRGTGAATTMAPVGQRSTQADFLNTTLEDVSPEYFETMGMHILAGRGLTLDDIPPPKPEGPMRAVVNRAFVKRFFPDTGPLGKFVGVAAPGEVAGKNYEIVGVVSDIKYRSPRAPFLPMTYTCQVDFDQVVLNVRTYMSPAAILVPVRKTVASLDPGVPIIEEHTMTEEIDIMTGPERVTAGLAFLFGGIAALLVAVGIYGLLACAVTQRRREIGIRMALGARREDVLKLVVGQGLKLVLIGVGAGLPASFIAARFFASLLYGVKPNDPLTFVAMVLLLIVLALLASYIPARRATKVDPMASLRCE